MTKKPIKAAEAVRIAKAVNKVPALNARRKLMHAHDHIAEAREHAGKAYVALVALQAVDMCDDLAVEKLYDLAHDLSELRRICYQMAVTGERRNKGDKARALFDGIVERSGGKKNAGPPPSARSAVPAVIRIDRKTGRRIK